jgi:hypothetical protein
MEKVMEKANLFRRLGQKMLNLLRPKIVFSAAAAILIIAIPFGARAQFGLDPCCAIISAGLNSISGLLSSVVAKPLGSIQQLQQQASNFEQQVVYPASAIANAKNLVTQLQGQLQQSGRLYQLPINSATLAAPQQLEQAALSHNPGALGQITQSYTALYGATMPATAAPQPVRDVVDMTDAEAQAALKKAVELDALADIELAAANQITQQLQSATPGSAPILEAQAAAWLVRSNAYTQSAMAELVRVRSISLANASSQIKFSTADANDLGKSIGHALGQE